jgi:hypothetical protein
VRGAKVKKETYIIKDESSAISDRVRVGGCRELQSP